MSQAPATPAPTPQAQPSASAAAAATPVATPRPIPTPSLKPGETITWIRIERPKLALGEIIVGSFALAGVLALVAILIGMVIGHLRSKRRQPVGTGGLGLNKPDPESV